MRVMCMSFTMISTELHFLLTKVFTPFATEHFSESILFDIESCDSCLKEYIEQKSAIETHINKN